MRLIRPFSKAIAVAVLTSLLVAACQQSIPPEALQLTQESLEQRQLQTRRFDTADEARILSASAAVMQDLGFTLDESETKLGLIVGSKDRDATEAGQIAAAIFVAVLTGAIMPTDKNQKIRVSLVTRPYGDEHKSIAVRVTFQRIVWNTRNEVSRIEQLDDPKLYQEFFDRLSKSVFLEAHKI